MSNAEDRVRAAAGVIWHRALQGKSSVRFPPAGEEREWILAIAKDALSAADKAAARPSLSRLRDVAMQHRELWPTDGCICGQWIPGANLAELVDNHRAHQLAMMEAET